jgi:hypothetical protein
MFLAVALTLFGGYLMASSMEILARPPIPETPNWTVYHLNLMSPDAFWMGLVMFAIGLTLIQVSRNLKSNRIPAKRDTP